MVMNIIWGEEVIILDFPLAAKLSGKKSKLDFSRRFIAMEKFSWVYKAIEIISVDLNFSSVIDYGKCR